MGETQSIFSLFFFVFLFFWRDSFRCASLGGARDAMRCDGIDRVSIPTPSDAANPNDGLQLT